MELVSLGIQGQNPTLKDAAVSWIAHPYWLMKDFKFTIERIKKTVVSNDDIYGMELYNDGLKQLTNEQIEYLSDVPCNYYAVDDLHIPSQINQGWVEMEVDSLDRDTVLENLKNGNYWMVIKK